MKSILYFFAFFFLLNLTIYSQVFDWEWQNGKPIGANLNDITQLPNGNYIAVKYGLEGIKKVVTDGAAYLSDRSKVEQIEN